MKNDAKDWALVVGELAPHLGLILATVVHLNGTIDAAAWLELLKWYIGFTAASVGLRAAGSSVGAAVKHTGDRIYAAFRVETDNDEPPVPDDGHVYKMVRIDKGKSE